MEQNVDPFGCFGDFLDTVHSRLKVPSHRTNMIQLAIAGEPKALICHNNRRVLMYLSIVDVFQKARRTAVNEMLAEESRKRIFGMVVQLGRDETGRSMPFEVLEVTMDYVGPALSFAKLVVRARALRVMPQQ